MSNLLFQIEKKKKTEVLNRAKQTEKDIFYQQFIKDMSLKSMIKEHKPEIKSIKLIMRYYDLKLNTAIWKI